MYELHEILRALERIGEYWWLDVVFFEIASDNFQKKKQKKTIGRRKSRRKMWKNEEFLREIQAENLLNHLLNARLCRLTETARLLKNVKSVFTRRSNAASRVNVEVELSRKFCHCVFKQNSLNARLGETCGDLSHSVSLSESDFSSRNKNSNY